MGHYAPGVILRHTSRRWWPVRLCMVRQ